MDKRTIISSLKSVGIAVLVSVGLIFGLNYVAFTLDNPEELIPVFVYFVLFISSLIIGVLCVRYECDNGYLATAVSSAIYCFIYSAVSILFNGKATVILLRCAVIFAAALLFAFIFKPRKQKQGKAMKEYKKAMKKS